MVSKSQDLKKSKTAVWVVLSFRTKVWVSFSHSLVLKNEGFPAGRYVGKRKSWSLEAWELMGWA